VFQDFWAHASEQSFKELNKSATPQKTETPSPSKNMGVEIGDTPSLI